MNLKNKLYSCICGLALLTPLQINAIEADFQQEVRVDAKRQSIDIQQGNVTFFDDVSVSQGTLKIFADKLSVEQGKEAGKEVLIAYGKPAKFSQQLENGRTMHAEADEIRYLLAERTIALHGNAVLTQQDSVVKSEHIRYNILRQQLVAESGNKETDRVTTIFLPEQLQEQLEEKE
jgi:lipopolysaccharide export system protein LptA